MPRNDSWFETGAAAIENLSGGSYCGVYVCPLCFRGYADIADLTVEHVPPNSLGGRPLTLTCERCNRWAGHELDHHWSSQRQAVNFIAGGLNRTQARILTGNGGLPVRASTTDRQVTIDVVLDAAHPDAYRALADTFSPDTPAGELRLSFPPFSERRAMVSRLRAAYLAAFAKFGYRYVSYLVIVRHQIANPDSETISSADIQLPVDMLATPDLLVCDIGGIGKAIVVQLGGEAVVLPLIADAGAEQEFWGAVACVRANKTATEFKARSVGWPRPQELLLDFGAMQP